MSRHTARLSPDRQCLFCKWDKILRIWEYEQHCALCKYNTRKNGTLDRFEPTEAQP